MTFEKLLANARTWKERFGGSGVFAAFARDELAQPIIELLGEAPPCGFESIAPTVAGTPDGWQVRIPDFMTFEPNEARAYAAMLLRAADEAEAK